MHGQPHPVGVITCENVAEIARRHDEVHLVAALYLSARDEVAVGGDVVGYLRREPAPVDGIGGGHLYAVRFQLFDDFRIGEHLFDRRLRVVEVALNARDVHVLPLLGEHLPLLHDADAVRGIEHDDLRPLHVAEAFQRRLARIAAGCDEDERAAFVAELLLGGDHEIRQQRERHILERIGRTVPQLQHIKPVVHLDEGARIVAVETRIRLAGVAEQFVVRKLVQIFRKHACRAFGIIHAEERVHFSVVQNGERRRNNESAVVRYTFDYCFRTGIGPHAVACADILHFSS